MLYTKMKSTGLDVSRFCLGTMTFGGQADAEESKKIFNACLDAGVNFFDTADIYTGGQSETILGGLMEGKRDELVLATKLGGRSGGGRNGSGLSRKHALQSVEGSLKRLKTDYIDVLYLHFPDYVTPAEELIVTMDGLVRSGKIRYWGVSNFPTWQLCRLCHTAKEMNCIGPSVSETVYNLLTRGAEDEFLPFLRAYGIGMTVFNPLAGGLLTGKHKRGKPVEGSRFALEGGYAKRYFNDRNFDAMEILEKTAAEQGMSLLELAIRWLLAKNEVTSLIVGASKAEQAVQNLSFFDNKPLEGVNEGCNEAWGLIKGNYFNYHY